MKRYFFTALLLAVSSGLMAGGLPGWFTILRDAVYAQQLSANEIEGLYRESAARAREELSGAGLSLMLSRCEYMMGRALQYEERKKEAGEHYAAGMGFAEQALKAEETAAGWQMLAENLSQNCAVRGTGYAIANGLDVEKYAKKALAIDSRNAAAQYMIAARWVFAPPPFGNLPKGIKMMTAILTEGDMDTDDLFNVRLAVGYAFVQQKKYDEARPWLIEALAIYPTNQFTQDLLEKR